MIVVLACVMLASFTACKSVEYENLFANLEKANFRATFTVYRNYSASAIRGSKTSAGGEQTYKSPATGEDTTDWIVDYSVVKYVQNTSSNFWMQVTSYTAITEDAYDKLSKGKEVEDIKIADYKTVTTYELKDGVFYINGTASDTVVDGMTILGIPKQFDETRSLGVTDGFKIYTRILQSNERYVYLVPETGAENVSVANLSSNKEVLKADNNAATKKYWTGSGEDITYDWEQVAGMINNRDTFSYDSGKARITQIDLYTETILSFYTEKNVLDKSLVLKAKSFSQQSTVIDIEYPKEGAFEVKAF